MQVKEQQLELDMEQQTGSKLGKEYVMQLLLSCFAVVIALTVGNTVLYGGRGQAMLAPGPWP